MLYEKITDINENIIGYYVLITNGFIDKIITKFCENNKITDLKKYNFPPIFYKISTKDNNYDKFLKVLKDYQYNMKNNFDYVITLPYYKEYPYLKRYINKSNDTKPRLKTGYTTKLISNTCVEIEWMIDNYCKNNRPNYEIIEDENNKLIKYFKINKLLLNDINRLTCELDKIYKGNNILIYDKYFPEKYKYSYINISLYEGYEDNNKLFEKNLQEYLKHEYKKNGSCGINNNIIDILGAPLIEIKVIRDHRQRILENIRKLRKKYPSYEKNYENSEIDVNDLFK